jgi:hypothetical protein
VCDLSRADVGIGEYRHGGLDVVVSEFWCQCNPDRPTYVALGLADIERPFGRR